MGYFLTLPLSTPRKPTNGQRNLSNDSILVKSGAGMGKRGGVRGGLFLQGKISSLEGMKILLHGNWYKLWRKWETRPLSLITCYPACLSNLGFTTRPRQAGQVHISVNLSWPAQFQHSNVVSHTIRSFIATMGDDSFHFEVLFAPCFAAAIVCTKPKNVRRWN